MEIVCIFAGHLFSFHYKHEAENEFERLMSLWTNVAYLYAFARQNNEEDVEGFVEAVLREAEAVQDFLARLKQKKVLYGSYFVPLNDAEWKNPDLSLRKGKVERNRLRLYAIKIDEDCFVITGGAIKMSQTMQGHPDTSKELDKLKNARRYLRQNDVFDEGSFFEFINE